MGSDHVKYFKNPPFNLTCSQQLMQVVKHLTTKSDDLDDYLLPSKIDEVLCRRGNPGNAVYFRGRPLWSVEVIKNKVNVCKNRWLGDEFVRTEVPQGYDVFSDRPMGPRWVNEDYPLQEKHLSGLVYMGNIKNWSEEVIEKFDEDAKNVSLPINQFCKQDLQKLCYEGQFFAILDPMDFFCREFGIKTRVLESAIQYEHDGLGWTCHLDPEIASKLDFEEPYHCVGHSNKTTPRVGLQFHDTEQKKAYYDLKYYAYLAEMYNLIFNHCARVKTHILHRLLRNCHQFVIIFPRKKDNQGHG